MLHSTEFSIEVIFLPAMCQKSRMVKKYIISIKPSTQNPVKNDAVPPMDTEFKKKNFKKIF